MNKFEQDYSAIIKKTLKNKMVVAGRNGNTLVATGVQIRADLKKGFPLVTGKKIFPNSIGVETEWFLSGYTNVRWLNERGVRIWDKWADENGELGPIYGKQLRNFNGRDQLIEVVKLAKKDPYSRRLVVNLWNPVDIPKMKLPPCHYGFQFVIYKKEVDIIVTMRSLDLFVGLPYDMAMYALILSAFVKELGDNYYAKNVIINAANAHIYEEHIDAATIYACSIKTQLPILINVPNILAFNHKGVVIENYNPNSRIKVNVKK